MARRSNSIAGLTKLIETVPAEAVVEIVEAIQSIAETETRRDGMSTISPYTNGERYGPYPLTVQVDRVKATKRRSTITVFGNPPGFWTWLEDGIPRHEVGGSKAWPRTSRTSGRGGRRSAMSTPDGPRTYAHASFPRRGTWSRVLERSGDEIDNVVGAVFDDVTGS